MVTKKASKEDTKQVSTPVEAKKAAVKTTAKKSAAAKTAETKTTTAAKTPAKKTAEKKPAAPKADYTPVTANKDVVNAVLEIKAKNATKKAAKAKPATVQGAKVPAVSESVEKGAKAVSAKSKRDTVKENAQKAEAKKFMALKEETAAENCCVVSCCLGGLKHAFAAWMDAYINIFNYKTRTNRCDFWAFMLINFILMLFVLVPYEYANYNALIYGEPVAPIKVYAYWAFSLIELLVYLALYVRRLHDMGSGGWKGFFRPMTYSALGIIALAVIGNFALPENELMTENANVAASLLGLGVLVLLFINLFYLIKTVIAVAFMEEERAENAYGAPKFTDDCCKGKILRYATWYTLLMVIYIIAIFAIQFSLYLTLFSRSFQ